MMEKNHQNPLQSFILCSIVLSFSFVCTLLYESRFSQFFLILVFFLNINAHSVERKVLKLF